MDSYLYNYRVQFCVHFAESRHVQISQRVGPRQRPMSAMRFTTSDSGHDSIANDVPPVLEETPVSSPRPAAAAAMNDTGKVKRLRPFTADARTRRDKSDQPAAAASAAAPTMDDFHRVSFQCDVSNFLLM